MIELISINILHEHRNRDADISDTKIKSFHPSQEYIFVYPFRNSAYIFFVVTACIGCREFRDNLSAGHIAMEIRWIFHR